MHFREHVEEITFRLARRDVCCALITRYRESRWVIHYTFWVTDWTFTFSWHFLHLETELLLLPVYNYYFSKFSVIYASSSRRISHLIFLPFWDLNWFLPLNEVRFMAPCISIQKKYTIRLKLLWLSIPRKKWPWAEEPTNSCINLLSQMSDHDWRSSHQHQIKRQRKLILAFSKITLLCLIQFIFSLLACTLGIA